jgi:hypothetical protein
LFLLPLSSPFFPSSTHSHLSIHTSLPFFVSSSSSIPKFVAIGLYT